MWVSQKDFNKIVNTVYEKLNSIENDIGYKNDLVLKVLRYNNATKQAQDLLNLVKHIKGHAVKCCTASCAYRGRCWLIEELDESVKKIECATGLNSQGLYTKEEITKLVSEALKEAAIKESNDLADKVAKAIEAKLK